MTCFYTTLHESDVWAAFSCCHDLQCNSMIHLIGQWHNNILILRSSYHYLQQDRVTDVVSAHSSENVEPEIKLSLTEKCFAAGMLFVFLSSSCVYLCV